MEWGGVVLGGGALAVDETGAGCGWSTDGVIVAWDWRFGGLLGSSCFRVDV